MAKKAVIQADSIQTIGLDIGYGDTKAVASHMTIKFPSVWSSSIDMKYQTGKTATDYPGDRITDESGDWFVGELARKHASPGKLRRLKGRTADELNIGHVDRLRLAKVAIGKLFPNRRNGEILHVRLATGLPVNHMRGAADFKTALIGQHRIQTDQTDFVANITEVIVMPQPYGTIYREMLTETGKLNPCHDYTRTGVVDVGSYTIDIAVDDDGEFMDGMSDTTEAGVFTIREAIVEAYRGKTNEVPLDVDVETIITGDGCIRINGKLENFTEVRAAAIRELSDSALYLIRQTWQGGAVVDVIYVSGGGASMVFKDIQAEYPQAQLTDESQLANAQGYFNYAVFKARNPA